MISTVGCHYPLVTGFGLAGLHRASSRFPLASYSIFTVRVRARIRVRVRTIVLSVDPGIELGLMVFVTSRRYHQTNSAQALKATNRFKRSTPWIQAHTQGCHDATTMCRSVYLSIHDKLRTTVIGS